MFYYWQANSNYINAINNDVFNPNKGNKIVGKLVIDKGDEIINSKIKFF